MTRCVAFGVDGNNAHWQCIAKIKQVKISLVRLHCVDLLSVLTWLGIGNSSIVFKLSGINLGIRENNSVACEHSANVVAVEMSNVQIINL